MANTDLITLGQLQSALNATKTYIDGKTIPIQSGTTSYWNNRTGYVPTDGEIIIYTDYATVTKISPVSGSEITVPVPGIKVGNNNAFVQDLAFVGEYERDLLLDHIQNTQIHVSVEDRQKWNNKINCENQINNETLILNRL